MLKKVQPSQLCCGMYLEKLSGPWIKNPFWRHSFLLKDPKDIARIIGSNIEGIWIDISKGLDVQEAIPITETSESLKAEPYTDTASASDRKSSIKAEYARAHKICIASQEAIETMFQEARMGKAISAKNAGAQVKVITESVMRNPEALISIARLKTRDNYTYLHSVAVCALMIVLARELGLNEEQTKEAGFGGLLHDLGKSMMPLEVLNKPGRLTDDEFRTIQTHPQKGYELLREGGASSETTLDIVLHHHEKIDGSGYPDGLAGDDITTLTRMSAICDVYDAVTSNRPYKAGWDPAVSINRMASWKGHFDQRIFKAFVKSIGIYPVGSLVRLESEKLGVVIELGSRSLLNPKVRTFFSTKLKEQIPIMITDLSAPECQERIISIEDPQKWGFHKLEDLWLEK